MPELENAQVHWLDSGQPYSEKFTDIYFSNQGGLEESEYVFLHANKLAQRWHQTTHNNSVFTVAELGFGTGLNFLMTWRLWKSLPRANRILNYIAFEKHPLKRTDLQRALAQWPELKSLSDELLEFYVDHSAGIHRLCLQDVNLDLYFGDATTMLQDRHENPGSKVDCWYMDGFSPRLNPAMWGAELLHLMFLHSAAGATLSTYSSAGSVKRNLMAAGFNVSKQTGFGSKRDMLVAQKHGETATPAVPVTKPRPPWFRVPPTLRSEKSAIVIGAGLAGCSTAYNLSRRGWQVTLIDREKQIAAGASGNTQAVLQPRLAANFSVISRFYLHGLLFAQRQMSQFEKSAGIDWHNCGVLKLGRQAATDSDGALSNIASYYDPRMLTCLTRKDASQLANAELKGDALWLPLGGWLNPKKLCDAYLSLASRNPIKLVMEAKVCGLHRQNNGWLVDVNETILPYADVVVLATGSECSNFEQTASLPLVAVRGQVSQLSSNPRSDRLATVVVAERFICPAHEGSHCIGASYDADAVSADSHDGKDLENLGGVRSAFSETDFLGASITDSRVSTRCNSTDFYPVVGAVPDFTEFQQDFAPLLHNARAILQRPGTYLPGLFVNTAHGSYGLTSCPLSGEYLASLINNECLPLSAATMDSLSPARFVIRNLKKQRLEMGKRRVPDLPT